MNNAQIKKFYENQTQWKIPNRWFHIHHIDSDRSNNDISNLVALPIQVHLRYHGFFQRFLPSLRMNLEDKTFIQSKSGFLTSPEIINNMIKNLQEVRERYTDYYSWIEFRNFLLFMATKGQVCLNHNNYLSSWESLKQLRKEFLITKGQVKRFAGLKPKLVF